MLRSAIAESSIRYDSAGNPALDKARARSRIDALQAAVIAACLGEMVAARPVRRRLRSTLVWAKRHYGVVQNTNRLMELSCYFFGFDHPTKLAFRLDQDWGADQSSCHPDFSTSRAPSEFARCPERAKLPTAAQVQPAEPMRYLPVPHIPWQLGQPGRGSDAPGGVPASSKMAAWISNK